MKSKPLQLSTDDSLEIHKFLKENCIVCNYEGCYSGVIINSESGIIQTKNKIINWEKPKGSRKHKVWIESY